MSLPTEGFWVIYVSEHLHVHKKDLADALFLLHVHIKDIADALFLLHVHIKDVADALSLLHVIYLVHNIIIHVPV